jgi:hypothetical protein
MKLFEKNVGGIDRGLRLVVGLLLVACALFAQMDGLARLLVGAFGLIVLLTGAFGTCYLYTLLGFSTAKK